MSYFLRDLALVCDAAKSSTTDAADWSLVFFGVLTPFSVSFEAVRGDLGSAFSAVNKLFGMVAVRPGYMIRDFFESKNKYFFVQLTRPDTQNDFKIKVPCVSSSLFASSSVSSTINFFSISFAFVTRGRLVVFRSFEVSTLAEVSDSSFSDEEVAAELDSFDSFFFKKLRTNRTNNLIK